MAASNYGHLSYDVVNGRFTPYTDIWPDLTSNLADVRFVLL